VAAAQQEQKVSGAAQALGRTKKERLKAIDQLVKLASTSFGKGSLMTLRGKHGITLNVDAISTGSLGLDRATGIGGITRGRITEIYGPEAGGKTTLALHCIANCQANGGVAAFVDAEHALDPKYAEKLGVDLEELLISQPDCGEQALEIVDTLVRSGSVDLIVVDSVAALVPRAELEGDVGDHHPGSQARLMSQSLRKITGFVGKTQTAVVFINQIRHKIGVSYGSPETTSGGNALKFYASMRFDIRRIGSLRATSANGAPVIGNRVRIKIAKNKLAPPFLQVEVNIVFGEGVDWRSEILDFGVSVGIFNKSGSWYSMSKAFDEAETRMGQGRNSAIAFLKDNPKVTQRAREMLTA